MTGAIGTSFTPYAEAADKSTMPVVPVIFTIFPKDLVIAPQEFARRHFTVASWHDMPVGGHFAAWDVNGPEAIKETGSSRLGWG